MSSIKKMIDDPSYLASLIMIKLKLFRLIDDERYLKIMFRLKMGEPLNLDSPGTYNEKLQWLKLFDRKSIYTTLVDKYAVKAWVASRIGSEYVAKVYGVWDKAEEIEYEKLPKQFVLKTNHDCGGVVVCKDSSTFDRDAAKRFLNRHLKRNFYYEWREWPYRDVRPRIFAEEYLEDNASGELPDYKFFCFNGEPKAMFIATDRLVKDEETKFDFFDMKFNHLPVVNGHPNSKKPIAKPENFDLMINLARKLSEGIPHVRVDFYEAGGRLYFGEMTFFHWSGMVPFDPKSWDERFGSWIKLPNNTKANQ